MTKAELKKRDAAIEKQLEPLWAKCRAGEKLTVGEEMRVALLHAKVVKLDTGYLNRHFVAECIEELEKKSILWASSIDEPTPLEKLGYYALMTGAGLDVTPKKKKTR